MGLPPTYDPWHIPIVVSTLCPYRQLISIHRHIDLQVPSSFEVVSGYLDALHILGTMYPVLHHSPSLAIGVHDDIPMLISVESFYMM